MQDIARLAVIERGEPVARVVAAVATENRAGDPPTATIVVSERSREQAWFAREADELITVISGTAPGDPGVAPAAMVAAVVEARADTAWVGHTPCLDRTELIEGLQQAGIRVVGSSAPTLRALADPDQMLSLIHI